MVVMYKKYKVGHHLKYPC